MIRVIHLLFISFTKALEYPGTIPASLVAADKSGESKILLWEVASPTYPTYPFLWGAVTCVKVMGLPISSAGPESFTYMVATETGFFSDFSTSFANFSWDEFINTSTHFYGFDTDPHDGVAFRSTIIYDRESYSECRYYFDSNQTEQFLKIFVEYQGVHGGMIDHGGTLSGSKPNAMTGLLATAASLFFFLQGIL